jgi:hypothetical protein
MNQQIGFDHPRVLSMQWALQTAVQGEDYYAIVSRAERYHAFLVKDAPKSE